MKKRNRRLLHDIIKFTAIFLILGAAFVASISVMKMRVGFTVLIERNVEDDERNY